MNVSVLMVALTMAAQAGEAPRTPAYVCQTSCTTQSSCTTPAHGCAAPPNCTAPADCCAPGHANVCDVADETCCAPSCGTAIQGCPEGCYCRKCVRRARRLRRCHGYDDFGCCSADGCNGNGCCDRGCCGRCCCGSTCDMFPHYPYMPTNRGYYYFRPYNWTMIGQHQSIVAAWGMDPVNPYTRVLFENLYADRPRAQIITPTVVSDERLPALESLLEPAAQ